MNKNNDATPIILQCYDYVYTICVKGEIKKNDIPSVI